MGYCQQENDNEPPRTTPDASDIQKTVTVLAKLQNEDKTIQASMLFSLVSENSEENGSTDQSFMNLENDEIYSLVADACGTDEDCKTNADSVVDACGTDEDCKTNADSVADACGTDEDCKTNADSVADACGTDKDCKTNADSVADACGTDDDRKANVGSVADACGTDEYCKTNADSVADACGTDDDRKANVGSVAVACQTLDDYETNVDSCPLNDITVNNSELQCSTEKCQLTNLAKISCSKKDVSKINTDDLTKSLNEARITTKTQKEKSNQTLKEESVSADASIADFDTIKSLGKGG